MSSQLHTNVSGSDRRRHRRHSIAIDPARDAGRIGVCFEAGSEPTGSVVDLSAGGVRILTTDDSIRPGHDVEVSLVLPPHAGIQPFIRLAGTAPEPTCEWRGTLKVLRRIEREDGCFELGGQLVDMTAVDRGMLGLYLSIQPLAA